MKSESSKVPQLLKNKILIAALLSTVSLMMVATSGGSIDLLLTSLAFLTPSLWWLWCLSKDKAAIEKHQVKLKEYRELRILLKKTDPFVASQMSSPESPQKADRHWNILAPLSIGLLIAGTFLGPQTEEAAVSDYIESSSPDLPPQEPTRGQAEHTTVRTEVVETTTTVTASSSTVTVTQSPSYSPPADYSSQQEFVAPADLEPAVPAAPRSGSGYYPNCAAARSAGVAPLYSGQPGYRSGLDRDNDGVACE
ncbi:excalibur calcium-binding domain-containing protein [Corynebacterium falsenii]|uniref:excalibur calcium-binding domain-containing protein n=1 Tax=Corynebacterium falsenii TaxID=108486 RepID=UPI001CCFCB92|nr:excalibur calcium-binding domain-containing protein [Corynebacterium falsenii]UBI06425.1 excalibur calcium-binding domain-containing protein [Corynebacterium falsenii]